MIKTLIEVGTFIALALFLPAKVFVVFVFTTVRDTVDAIGEEVRAVRAARDEEQWDR
jgi:hypothetical protein